MFLESGFQDFMPKPIELSTLDKMLKTWLPGELLKKTAVVESPAEPSSPRHAALSEADDTLAGLIDTKLGMFYTGGQADADLNILSTYLNKGTGKIEKIRSLYEKREWKNYVIEVHALKSSSLSIGAKQLSELAKELEAAGKEGNVKLIEEKTQDCLTCTGRWWKPESNIWKAVLRCLLPNPLPMRRLLKPTRPSIFCQRSTVPDWRKS